MLFINEWIRVHVVPGFPAGTRRQNVAAPPYVRKRTSGCIRVLRKRVRGECRKSFRVAPTSWLAAERADLHADTAPSLPGGTFLEMLPTNPCAIRVMSMMTRNGKKRALLALLSECI